MAEAPPKSRPEPPAKPAPSVYGGQWGSGGKQGDAGTGDEDRPQPITTPHESTGTPDPENSPPIGD